MGTPPTDDELKVIFGSSKAWPGRPDTPDLRLLAWVVNQADTRVDDFAEKLPQIVGQVIDTDSLIYVLMGRYGKVGIHRTVRPMLASAALEAFYFGYRYAEAMRERQQDA